MQSLVDVALGTLFPELCDEWHSIKQNLHEYFTWERTEKERDIVRGLENMETPLQHALRDVVVGHVINIFPYVHCQSLIKCSRSPDTAPSIGTSPPLQEKGWKVRIFYAAVT